MAVAIKEKQTFVETLTFISGKAIITHCINRTPSTTSNKVKECTSTINCQFRRWYYWPGLLNKIGIIVSRIETSAKTFLKQFLLYQQFFPPSLYLFSLLRCSGFFNHSGSFCVWPFPHFNNLPQCPRSNHSGGRIRSLSHHLPKQVFW